MVTNGIFGGHDSWHGNGRVCWKITQPDLDSSNPPWLTSCPFTPPKTNMEPRNDDLEDVCPFLMGDFESSMLNFGGVCPFYQACSTSSIGSFLNVCFTEGKKSRPFFVVKWKHSNQLGQLSLSGSIWWFPMISYFKHTSSYFSDLSYPLNRY